MQTNLLEQIKEIVCAAGELIRDIDEITELKHKEGPANFVTKYDSMVQAYLIKHLSAVLPEASFLGEEDGLSERTVGDGYTFIIDPIDGTTNFICGFLFSAISVGLSYQQQTVLSVVYNPFRQELFYAQRGKGAFLNGKRLTMQERPLSQGVVYFDATPYNPELRDASFALAKEVTYHTMDLRELGSAALGICYVACNRCVAYVSPRLSVWDYAGASLIVEEAGGILSDLSGRNLNLRAKTTVLASTLSGKKRLLELAETYADAFI